MTGFPQWMSWYKKPNFVDYNQYAAALQEGTAPASSRSSGESARKRNDIPKTLSLERIMQNKTCSPMSLYDFYMYLKYIEMSSENLEFYVWFKNYEKGRLTAFPDAPRVPVTPDTSSEASFNKDPEKGNPSEDGTKYELDDNELYARFASFAVPGTGCGGDSCLAPGMSASRRNSTRDTSSFSPRPFLDVSTTKKERVETNEENQEAQNRPQSQMHTAEHAELETIRDLFLTIGSPKELNLPAATRTKVIEAINSGSSDPENLRNAAEHCYLLLKSCSHRNFVRLGVGNGTFETLCMATSLGIVLTVMGFVSMILLAFVSPSFRNCSRWHGIGIWPMWLVGVSLLLSGLRGSCFFLLLFSRRQPLPWERFDEDKPQTGRESGRIVTFMKKMMIFDRKMKVKDDDLRRLQRKVVGQSLAGGAIFATVFVVVFLCLPIWTPL